MLVSGRVIAFLFVFGAKFVDFFATLMMRSLFYSLKKTIKTPLAKRRLKDPMGLATPMACGRASGLRIPPVRRTRALLTAIGQVDPNCSSWPGFSEHFLGGTLVGSLVPPSRKNSEVRLEFFNCFILYEHFKRIKTHAGKTSN